MKGIACGKCMEIRTLPCTPPMREWITCRCGNLKGRWVDPERGIAEFTARDYGTAFVVGFNNQFLVPALHGKADLHDHARALHDLATDAPGYVFDKSRAGCWAIVFRPGSTNDTSFIPWAEHDQAGLAPDDPGPIEHG